MADAAIVGAGASGMLAAALLRRAGVACDLYEKMDRCGLKLGITGKGRCNLTNLHAVRQGYHGENPSFSEYPIAAFPPEETLEFGRRLGMKAQPGEVYTLVGDLGVGKTVLTQGIALGLEIEEPICSPTFTIVQVYEEGRMPFYHFDVYRIGDIEEMDEIGYEDYFYGEGLCMIEWANLIEEILPPVRKDIVIEKDLDKGFDYRKITITEVG